ncbi:ATP-dependent protease LonB [Proteinivorax hydrogeniformans]|uniref:endopeptidase La n=1 Tax=Proteinivorax hydrogeniformans TaxID=1826727 RepID=A0AAU8HWB9_9FIRM
MSEIIGLLTFIQIFFAIVIGLYFWNLLRSQQSNKSAVEKESRKELDKLRTMKSISLTEPLAEKTRPSQFSEIIGQDQGLKALRASLCGSNPQHVIIYGPPGVGKTAAARLVLEEAKRNPISPFKNDAKFFELDATTARFDERGIADPLIGSVHDPIYQGAGAMGMAGIPQPKPGAVTKAHGGMLFIDEIGELHNIQMNKLLKVLEDRKVFLESAYYSSEDSNIPTHIHEIFQKGLPADFRLVGATTRQPQDIPPAIRSRCVEVFFRSLQPKEISEIARNASKKINFPIEDKALDVLTRYATNGREAVNVIQIAAGIATNEGRINLIPADIEWVVNSSQITPRPERKVNKTPQIGCVNGLAVYGPNMGAILELEVTANKVSKEGKVMMTGVVEEEQLGNGGGKTIKRKSMAKGSLDNVLTAIKKYLKVPLENYDIHINFPGGTPVDGPSAGVAIAIGIYSAITEKPIDNLTAMTGEISIRGYIKPVGGIVPKVEAAKQAGAKKVFIPRENWQDVLQQIEGITVIPVDTLDEVITELIGQGDTVDKKQIISAVPATHA